MLLFVTLLPLIFHMAAADAMSSLEVLQKMCPGAEYLLRPNQTNITVWSENVPDCSESLPNFPQTPGAVLGSCGDRRSTFCRLHVQGERGKVLRANVSYVSSDCWQWGNDAAIFFYDRWNFSFPSDQRGLFFQLTCSARQDYQLAVVSLTNHLYISYLHYPVIDVEIFVKKQAYLKKVDMSERYGYIVPVHSQERFIQRDVHMDVQVPPGHVVRTSRQRDKTARLSFGQFLHKVFYLDESDGLTWKYTLGKLQYVTASVFRFTYGFKSDQTLTDKLCFSFHLPNEMLKTVGRSSLFNCSVDVYSHFQPHLECNQLPECADGRDEDVHCPYTSPACGGLVAARDKCFKVLSSKSEVSGVLMRSECHKNGGDLVSIKTEAEVVDFLQVFRHFYTVYVIVGYLGGGEFIPFMYRRFDRWADNTVIYNLHHLDAQCCCSTKLRLGAQFSKNGLFCVGLMRYLTSLANTGKRIVCEIKLPPSQRSPLQKVVVQEAGEHLADSVQTKHSLQACPQTGMIHSILSCDFKSRCANYMKSKVCTFGRSNSTGTDRHLTEKEKQYDIHLYICGDEFSYVPHILVCDFRQDCPDNSDESFCQHPLCADGACANGQCISHDQTCNGYPDCIDESDEAACYVTDDSRFLKQPKDEMYLINLDGVGYFTHLKMDRNASCPNTHYRCTSELLYCLPVYTRCNGLSDCVYGEDEEGCAMIRCPGLYLCRGSKVCVHVDSLCDGKKQCPQEDDEWFCESACPQHCVCQAEEFVCPQPFSVHRFPQIRYLDATGSGMLLSHVEQNIYLVYLSLADCFLSILHDVQLPNLRSLILSDNFLRTVPVDFFFSLSTLQTVVLANNPLTSFGRQSTPQVHRALVRMDLSKTRLEVLRENDFKGFYRLRYLNLSYSAIHTIEGPHFQNFSRLKKLDLRGNPVSRFPLDMFSGLESLSTVYSSNDRLCCIEMIIQTRASTKCFSPQTRLPLCENLLQSDFYRVVWWLTSLTAVVGNAACLVSHYVTKKPFFTHSFLTCLFNLNIANLCTGIYLCTIAAANELFHGVFFHVEDEWIKSRACLFTGFLSLLSNDVSAMILLFITVDHIIVLRFPSSSYRFNQSSTILACASAWLLSFSVTSISALQRQSNWIRFGYDSLCHPGLLQQHYFKEEFLWFSAIELFHLIIFLLLSAGQGIIYKAAPRYRIISTPTQQAVFHSAQLTVQTASSHAACWISATCLSLMNFAGVAESDFIHVALAVLAVSLHSAVNPVLYLWSLATHRRKEEREEKVLKILKSQRLLSRQNMA